MARKIYERMNDDQKHEALEKFKVDIQKLRNEYEKDYPVVVRDAIEEAIHVYEKDVAYLKENLKLS
ncbi:hypothetical protein [Sporolactobacillus spathodeae]|uniref:Uncharacterized protein n=1 Tax=Sporolactobacillus spathodeae TaxID=1465502 RepID=A0ABS2Q5E8_9BACL|nr:hypothetical protein [Sporolactobacillus spathodeae]MBM7656995.1 hypothetical protein [Sporolactobacillus spathodeae]